MVFKLKKQQPYFTRPDGIDIISNQFLKYCFVDIFGSYQDQTNHIGR